MTDAGDKNVLTIEQTLAEHGFAVHPIKGVSMMPLLRQGKDSVSIVALSDEGKCNLKINDVPLYRLPSGRLVLHRILDVRDGYYLIRGDNLKTFEKISPKLIIGKAEGFYRDDVYFAADHPEYLKYVKKVTRCWRLKRIFYYPVYRFAAKVKHKLFK
ncbi:MAG: hypothetical protein E7589_08350 [Ruminococcaceae bacterium]|nr:hypothetical protein [Oscillospiraceae bacterium]